MEIFIEISIKNMKRLNRQTQQDKEINLLNDFLKWNEINNTLLILYKPL